MSAAAPAPAPAAAAGPFAPPTGDPSGVPATPTTAVVPQGGAPAPDVQGAPRRAGVRARVRGTSTPTLLRWLRRLAVTLVVVFGLTAAGTMLQTRFAMDTASANTVQFQRVQAVQAHLLAAHATAANGFLLGGAETAEQQQSFRTEIAEASRTLVEAANAEPGDRDALLALSDVIGEYTSEVEAARADNRQNLPIGEAQLYRANDVINDRALPLLASLSDANTARVDGNTMTLSPLWLLVPGILALAAILWAMVEMARRTHRVLNLGLLLAALSIAAATTLGVVSMNGINDTIRDTRAGSLATTRAASAARAHAYGAKAMESLSLVSRAGDGSRFESQVASELWQSRTSLHGIADESTSASLRKALRNWSMTHSEIASMEYRGEHARAVAKATGSGPLDSNAQFAAFDQAVTDVAESSGAMASSALAESGGSLLVRLGALAALTLLALGAANLGIGQRLKEYL